MSSHANQLKGAKRHQLNHSNLLSRYFSAHLIALKVSFKNLFLSPMASAITILAIGLSLAFPMGCYMFIKNVAIASHHWTDGATLTLFLKHDVEESKARDLITQLQQAQEVKSLHYQTPGEALDEFKRLSNFEDALSLLPENPLPGVITLKIHPDYQDIENIQSLKQSIQAMNEIERLVLDIEWVKRLHALLHLAKELAFLVSVMICMGVILIVGNTLRLALEKHKDEIEVLNLMGATAAFIRRPFLYRGLCFGVFGALIAYITITIAINHLQEPSQALAQLYGGQFRLENLGFYDTLALLLASSGLGWLGAWIAVAQQSRDFKVN